MEDLPTTDFSVIPVFHCTDFPSVNSYSACTEHTLDMSFRASMSMGEGFLPCSKKALDL